MIRHTTKTIFVECTNCQTITDFHDFHGKCPACGETICEARYDLLGLDVKQWLHEISQRPASLWRYHEVLPVFNPENIVTMNEGGDAAAAQHEPRRQLGFEEPVPQR